MLGLVIVIANGVEAMTGFGSTVVSIALGSSFMPIKELVPVILPLNMVLSSYLILMYWGGVDRRLLFRRLLPYSLLGLPVGMGLYLIADSRIVGGIFGFFVVSLSLAELARGSKPQVPPSAAIREDRFGWIWLVLGGVMQGVCAAGGPMIVYYSTSRCVNRHSFRVTLSCLWFVLNGLMLVSYLVAGTMDQTTLMVSLKLVPYLFGGILLGETAHRRVPESGFRVIVFFLLTVVGGYMVVDSLF